MDFEIAKAELAKMNKKIVFPEGDDLRIMKAASRLNKDNVAKVILLGNVDEINKIANDNNIDLVGVEIKDHLTDPDFNDNVNKMFEIRRGKNTLEDCKRLLSGRNYYGVMMLYNGECDALLGGATYSTADTVRPALQIIKTKPNSKIVSSCFLMQKDGEKPLIFADCGINVNPSSEELKDIAKDSAESARVFGIDPKVAFLSFSTKGSAKSSEVDKVVKAVELLKEEGADFEFDGELQFDAAFVESVGKQKAKDSKVAGCANVFIFPDLQSGNIGYKIAQRLGGYEALGPILQGIRKPINDLSRGCNEEDIYKMAIITLLQK